MFGCPSEFTLFTTVFACGSCDCNVWLPLHFDYQNMKLADRNMHWQTDDELKESATTLYKEREIHPSVKDL